MGREALTPVIKLSTSNRARAWWLGSWFGGLALTNGGLGAAHGPGAPIVRMFSAPHGAVCAALLPQVMRTNLQALRVRLPNGEALKRCDEVARLVTGNGSAMADEGVDWVVELVRDLRLPWLSAYGISQAAHG